MSNIQIESGINFLTRIKNSKLNLRNVETVLFPDGLKANDIVQLTVGNIYGKNLLLMHLMRNATLVDTYNSCSVGGLNTSVLFIDTSFQFQMNQFVTCLCSYVYSLDFHNFCLSDKDNVVEKSLENTTYIACYDSLQLLATFHYLRTTISQNPKLKLLILDNIGFNYWQDSVNGGIRRMDLYEKKMISMLQRLTKDFKLSILYTRPKFFALRNPVGCDIANYKLYLKEKNDNTFEVDVSTMISKFNRQFMVVANSLEWQ